MTFLQAGQDLRIGGRQSNAQYQYTIQSENPGDLVKWGPIVLAEMRKLTGFTDVNSDQQNAGLQASLSYDRQTAARLGISAQMLDDTLYDAFGQRQVSTMFTSLNQYHVVMEVDPQFWQDPKGLNAIYIRPASSPTPIAGPGSSQLGSALTVGTTSSGPTSFQPAPVAILTPTPSPGTLADPNALLLASPAPTASPGFLSAVVSSTTSTPIATATPSTITASSTTTVTTLQVSSSPIAIATPASTPASLQLIPIPTPFATSAIAMTSSTPVANAVATSSGAGASSSPGLTPMPVVPLSAVASYNPTTAPIAVNHQGQFPSVTISFNLAGGMALGNAVTAIHQMQQRIGMPSAVHGSFSGTAEAFQASLAGEPFLILAALIAVYIVLGILYESYIHPITILSTLPSASCWRIVSSNAVPYRVKRHRDNRPPFAHRNREEKTRS